MRGGVAGFRLQDGKTCRRLWHAPRTSQPLPTAQGGEGQGGVASLCGRVVYFVRGVVQGGGGVWRPSDAVVPCSSQACLFEPKVCQTVS